YKTPTSLKPRTLRPLYTVKTIPPVSGGSQAADAESAVPVTSIKPKEKRFRMTAREWLAYDPSQGESEPLIGTPNKVIVGPLTKNLVIAGDKSFKTTFLMRLGASLAAGKTVFDELPVHHACRVVHIHAELNPAELQQRVIASVSGMPDRALDEFVNVRDTRVHL